jgi:hypothetical protein
VYRAHYSKVSLIETERLLAEVVGHELERLKRAGERDKCSESPLMRRSQLFLCVPFCSEFLSGKYAGNFTFQTMFFGYEVIVM